MARQTLRSQLISVASKDEIDQIEHSIASADMKGRETVKVGWLMRMLGARGDQRKTAEQIVCQELDDRGIRAK